MDVLVREPTVLLFCTMSFLSCNLHFHHFLSIWAFQCTFGVLVLMNTTPVASLSNTGWRGQSSWVVLKSQSCSSVVNLPWALQENWDANVPWSCK